MIDAELRVLAVYRAACAADGEPVRTMAVVDALLDERCRIGRILLNRWLNRF